MARNKNFLDWTLFTDPSSGRELHNNSIRKTLKYDIYQDKTKFKAVALTDMEPMSEEGSNIIAGSGTGDGSYTMQGFEDAELATMKNVRWQFKARILGHDSPHNFIPNPCDTTYVRTAEDMERAMSYVQMHTTFITPTDFDMDGGRELVKQGDIVWVQLEKNVSSYDLQLGKFLSKIKAEHIGNLENPTTVSGRAANWECENLQSIFNDKDASDTRPDRQGLIDPESYVTGPAPAGSARGNQSSTGRFAHNSAIVPTTLRIATNESFQWDPANIYNCPPEEHSHGHYEYSATGGFNVAIPNAPAANADDRFLWSAILSMGDRLVLPAPCKISRTEAALLPLEFYRSAFDIAQTYNLNFYGLCAIRLKEVGSGIKNYTEMARFEAHKWIRGDTGTATGARTRGDYAPGGSRYRSERHGGGGQESRTVSKTSNDRAPSVAVDAGWVPYADAELRRVCQCKRKNDGHYCPQSRFNRLDDGNYEYGTRVDYCPYARRENWTGFQRAYAINRLAAIASTSWGDFQVMGWFFEQADEGPGTMFRNASRLYGTDEGAEYFVERFMADPLATSLYSLGIWFRANEWKNARSIFNQASHRAMQIIQEMPEASDRTKANAIYRQRVFRDFALIYNGRNCCGDDNPGDNYDYKLGHNFAQVYPRCSIEAQVGTHSDLYPGTGDTAPLTWEEILHRSRNRFGTPVLNWLGTEMHVVYANNEGGVFSRGEVGDFEDPLASAHRLPDTSLESE